MVDCVIIDIDGTLVDSNYHHALAWYRALRRFNLAVPIWQIHRAIGMGGDQLVAHLAGDDIESAHGDGLRDAWSQEFQPLLGEICAFSDAVALLREIKNRGLPLVLASSGAPEHVDAYLDLVDGKRYADAWTTSADAQNTKPAPDLLAIALRKAGGGHAIMIGDSPWDVLAADKLAIPTFTVLTGGFSDAELRASGAAEVYSSLDEVQDHLDQLLA